MLSRYHIKVTNESLESFFDPASLREIARANVRQDSLPSLFGVEARRHVCDCAVGESLAYIAEEHAEIAALAQDAGGGSKQRAALGRLLHTVQDFYAHTNYVALWLAEYGGVRRLESSTRAWFDPAILAHPALQSAQWLTWRDPFYYLPGVGNVLRRFWLPDGSHEAINLDSPQRGENFHLAMAFARQRTRAEYAQAVTNVRARGGQEAVARFRGLASFAPNVVPREA